MPARFESVATKVGAKAAIKATGREFVAAMRKRFPARKIDAMIDEHVERMRVTSDRLFLAGVTEATGKTTAELRDLDAMIADLEDEDDEGGLADLDVPREDIVIGAMVRAGLHAQHGKSEAKFRKDNRALMVDTWSQHEAKMTARLVEGIAEDAIAAGLILLLDDTTDEMVEMTQRRGDNIAMNETQTLAAAENQESQRAAGVDGYLWKSQQDDDVRPNHVELDADDTVHSWSGTGPDEEGNHPGEANNCRCFAVPAMVEQIERFTTGAEAELFKAIQGRRLLTRGFPGRDL